MEFGKFGYFMKIDKRLKTLCEEFAGLEEAEKDYILGVSQTLLDSVFTGTTPLPVTGTIQAGNFLENAEYGSVRSPNGFF
jgi:hypothetical protein